MQILILNLLCRALTKAEANLRDILVRVKVKLDKNCKLLSEPENNGTITFDLKIPVGQERSQSYDVSVETGSLSSSTSSVRINAEAEQIWEKRRNFCKFCGKVEAPHKFSADLPFQTGCKDTVCRSDLDLDVFMEGLETEPHYVIGSSARITLAVIVSNKDQGEPAYKPAVTVKYPGNLQLSQQIDGCVQRNPDPSDSSQEQTLNCLMSGPIFPGDNKM